MSLMISSATAFNRLSSDRNRTGRRARRAPCVPHRAPRVPHARDRCGQPRSVTGTAGDRSGGPFLLVRALMVLVRRARDSNPRGRSGYRPNGFQDRLHRPLGQPSWSCGHHSARRPRSSGTGSLRSAGLRTHPPQPRVRPSPRSRSRRRPPRPPAPPPRGGAGDRCPVPAAAVHPHLAERDLVQFPAQLVQRHVAGWHEVRLRPLEPAPDVEHDEVVLRRRHQIGERPETASRGPPPAPIGGRSDGGRAGPGDADPHDLALCLGDLVETSAEQGERRPGRQEPSEIRGEAPVHPEVHGAGGVAGGEGPAVRVVRRKGVHPAPTAMAS